MNSKTYCKRIKEIEIPTISEIKETQEGVGIANAFLHLPQVLDIELDYNMQEELIKTIYDNRKNAIILTMAKELSKLNEEYIKELSNLQSIKEREERVSKKLKELGIEE